MQRGIEEARAVDHGNTLCLSLADAACIHAALVRDLAAAAQIVAALETQVEKHGLSFWYAYTLGLRGLIAAKRGDAAVAVPLLRAGLEGVRGTLFDARYIILLGSFAEVLGLARRFGEAFAAIDEAFARSADSEECWYVPELLRLKGEVVRLEGKPNAAAIAEESLRRSLARARGQDARSWELRAALSLARLCRDQGRVAEARDILAPVHDRFTEGFGTADLRTAKAFLDDRVGIARYPVGL